MPPRYVLMTGAKDNAGDFLIRRRTEELLRTWRPDREIVHYEAWKPLAEERLKVVNESSALILAGGPALQYGMHPVVYPLVSDLNRIAVPIVLMGVGWKSIEGSWAATARYPLSAPTLALLKRSQESPCPSSVRDYHTRMVLLNCGFRNVLVTGCPALYAPVAERLPAPRSSAIREISFSLGVSFVTNAGMEVSMKKTIERLVHAFPGARVRAVFHHSLQPRSHLHSGREYNAFLDRHLQFANWLTRAGIEHLDVSGEADRMLAHYRECDLHVGFRVHAHLLMSSWSRPSMLLTEDGRGKAMTDVIGGLSVDGYTFRPREGLAVRLLDRLGLRRHQYLQPDPSLPRTVVENLRYEIDEGFPRLSQVEGAIDRHFECMKRFIAQLP